MFTGEVVPCSLPTSSVPFRGLPAVKPSTVAYRMDPDVICAISWNVLAHPHTRHNAAFHGNPLTELPAQRDRRYELNAALLAASGAQIICLQEADDAFLAILSPYYSVLRSTSNHSGEGCAILVQSAAKSRVRSLRSFALDLGRGKFAVGVELQVSTAAGPSTPLWLVSLHLQGGPHAHTRGLQVASICDEVIRLAGRGEAGCSDPFFGARVVLCGDWNDTEPQNLASVAAAKLRLFPATGPTGLSADFSAAIQIDWVAASQAAATSILALDRTAGGLGDGGRSGAVSVSHVPASPWLDDATVGSDHVPLFFSLAL